jgi:hypothetical protein
MQFPISKLQWDKRWFDLRGAWRELVAYTEVLDATKNGTLATVFGGFFASRSVSHLCWTWPRSFLNIVEFAGTVA